MRKEEKELLPVDRFLATLDIVQKEGLHLSFSWDRMFSSGDVSAQWVDALRNDPAQAEKLEAFVSRYGRMQDTITDKLLPRWLLALAEKESSRIEVLNRSEQLGVVENVEYWLEARKLRNALVHEYMESTQRFAEDINLAKKYALQFFETYNNLHAYAQERMELTANLLPSPLELP